MCDEQAARMAEMWRKEDVLTAFRDFYETTTHHLDMLKGCDTERAVSELEELIAAVEAGA